MRYMRPFLREGGEGTDRQTDRICGHVNENVEEILLYMCVSLCTLIALPQRF